MDIFKTSKASAVATDDFNNTNNPIWRFIRDRIVRDGKETQAKVLYEAYMAYCSDEGVRAISPYAFSELMLFNDFEKQERRWVFWQNCSLALAL